MGFFQCHLPEDTIDVEITVRTLKGILTFRKDCSSQSSVCSPWGSCVKPFPSLHEKMADYIKERQTIANPFHCNQSFPNRPNSSLLANLCKAAPKREKNSKSHSKENTKEPYSKQEGYLQSPAQGKS